MQLHNERRPDKTTIRAAAFGTLTSTVTLPSFAIMTTNGVVHDDKFTQAASPLAVDEVPPLIQPRSTDWSQSGPVRRGCPVDRGGGREAAVYRRVEPMLAEGPKTASHHILLPFDDRAVHAGGLIDTEETPAGDLSNRLG